MIAIEPFAPEHLESLSLQPAQAGEAPPSLGDHGRALAAGGPAFTARGEDGRILGCAGFVENHAGYATAWAFVAADVGLAMRGITRAVRGVLDAAQYRRIDMTVRADFVIGIKWAERSLGFAREGLLSAWGADGGDYFIYARVRRR